MRDKIEEILLRDDRVKDGDTDLVHVEHDIDAILSTIREELLKAMPTDKINKKKLGLEDKNNLRLAINIARLDGRIETLKEVKEIINEKLK